MVSAHRTLLTCKAWIPTLAFCDQDRNSDLAFANSGLAFVSFLQPDAISVIDGIGLHKNSQDSRTIMNPFFVLLVKMKRKYPTGKFTKHAFDRHRKLLAEIPENVAQRQQNIHNRNQMFSATQAYNLKLEQQRIHSHIRDFAAPLQNAMAQHHMGDLDRRSHRLASSGLP